MFDFTNTLPFILDYSVDIKTLNQEAIRGTYFFIKFESRYFIISVRHIYRDFSEESIRFNDVYFNDYLSFFTLNHRVAIRYPDNPDEKDVEDLFIIEFDIEQQQLNHSESIRSRVYTFTQRSPNLQNGDSIFFVGYPDHISDEVHTTNYDLDNNHIIFSRVTIRGFLDDQDDLGFIHRIKMEDKFLLGNMSGSPVYKYFNHYLYLVGVIVRGGNNDRPSEFCYFIDSVVIYNALRLYLNNKSCVI